MENSYYSVEREMVEVDKAEFDNYIKNYPRPLLENVHTVCTPFVKSFNDLELANRWPYCTVARHTVEAGICDLPDFEEEFWVCKNVQDCFDSRFEQAVS